MISVLIDFFLDKKSPLVNFSEKKNIVGTRAGNPGFDPLIKALNILVKRVKNPEHELQSPYLTKNKKVNL